MNTLLSFFFMLFSIVILSLSSIAQPNPGLKNIEKNDTLFVLIEMLGIEEIKAGLTNNLIKTTITQKFSNAEIVPIYKFQKGHPFLYVNIGTIENTFCISLEYQREVYLYDENTIFQEMIATVWDSKRFGTYSTEVKFILDVLGNMINEFLIEYMKSNSG